MATSDEQRREMEKEILRRVAFLAPADLERLSDADLETALNLTRPGSRYLRDLVVRDAAHRMG